MAHDSEWFKRKIAATPEGSQRKLAAKLINSEGRPMNVASLNQIVNGVRPMFLSDAIQLSKAFGVPLDEIVKRAGLK